jgi:hypothetical protein
MRAQKLEYFTVPALGKQVPVKLANNHLITLLKKA